jgi:hypothetical protein
VEEGEDGGFFPGEDPLGLVSGGEVLHLGPQLLGDPREDGVPGVTQTEQKFPN